MRNMLLCNLMSEKQVIPLAEAPSLSRERLGGYLAGFGNHEGKAITLVGMEPNVDYGESALHRLYVSAQGSQPAHIGAVSNQLDYCMHSLEPVGAVARVTAADTLRYELTEEGAVLGKALAGHLLDFSLRHLDMSLGQIFGMTVSNTPSLRSPMRRAELLALLEGNVAPVQVVRLASGLAMSYETIGRHVKGLADSGLIVGDSIGLEAFSAQYIQREAITDYKPFKSYRTFSQCTVQILNELLETGGPVTTDVVQARLAALPQYGGYSSENLRNLTSRCLSNFAKQGIIEREGEYGRYLRSFIYIPDDKRPAITKLLGLLRSFQSGDKLFITEGLRKAAAIIADQEAVRALIGKAIAHSPTANKSDISETASRIKHMLGDGDATTNEVKDVLVTAGYAKGAARYVLDIMFKRGEVEKVRVGSHVLWALSMRPESTPEE